MARFVIFISLTKGNVFRRILMILWILMWRPLQKEVKNIIAQQEIDWLIDWSRNRLMIMLRRNPTRIELKAEDMQVYYQYFSGVQGRATREFIYCLQKRILEYTMNSVLVAKNWFGSLFSNILLWLFSKQYYSLTWEVVGGNWPGKECS